MALFDAASLVGVPREVVALLESGCADVARSSGQMAKWAASAVTAAYEPVQIDLTASPQGDVHWVVHQAFAFGYFGDPLSTNSPVLSFDFGIVPIDLPKDTLLQAESGLNIASRGQLQPTTVIRSFNAGLVGQPWEESFAAYFTALGAIPATIQKGFTLRFTCIPWPGAVTGGPLGGPGPGPGSRVYMFALVSEERNQGGR